MTAGERSPSLFAVVCLGVISHTAFSMSRMTVSLAAIRLDAPTYMVGVLLSLYSLLPMLLSVSSGRWIDRIGTRAPMLWSAIALAIGFALPAFLQDLASLYANSVLVGTAFMLFHMSIQKLTGELAGGPARLRNFSLLAVGYSISAFVGPILAGFLIDHAGAGASFGVSFAAASVLIVLAYVLLKWRWTFSGRSIVPPGTAPARGRVLDLMREPVLRRLYVSVVMTSMAWDMLLFMFPIQGSKIGLSASQIGIVLGAFSAATFVVRMAMPLIARRFTEWQLIGGVQAVASVVYLVFPLVTSHWGLIALSFTLGLGLGVGQPTVMALLHRVSPPGRVGEAVGLRMTLINGTQTVLPTAFGSAGSALSSVLTGSLTFAPIFWGVALLVGAGSVFTLRTREPVAREPR